MLKLDEKTKTDLDSFTGSSADALEWAKLFARVFARNPAAASDESYLHTIFAGAICAGADFMQRRIAALEAEVARITQERDAALAKAAEFDNIEDFPAELQVKCGTFTESARPGDCISIGKELYADLKADRERLDWLEDWLASSTPDSSREVRYGGSSNTGEAAWLCYPDEIKNDVEGETLRTAIDAARKAGA